MLIYLRSLHFLDSALGKTLPDFLHGGGSALVEFLLIWLVTVAILQGSTPYHDYMLR